MRRRASSPETDFARDARRVSGALCSPPVRTRPTWRRRRRARLVAWTDGGAAMAESKRVEMSREPPNAWHQRRAKRVRCMPGLGTECGCVKLGHEARIRGTEGRRDREAPCFGRRRMRRDAPRRHGEGCGRRSAPGEGPGCGGAEGGKRQERRPLAVDSANTERVKRPRTATPEKAEDARVEAPRAERREGW